MENWLDFGTCFEVDDEHIEHALAPAASIEEALPRARVFALLDRMAEVARPRQGGGRILFVLARLSSCDWLEGDLEVELRSEGNHTIVELTVNDGVLRSRLRPSLEMNVPFHEFETGVQRVGELIAPLTMTEHVDGQSLSLSVSYAGGAAPEDERASRPTARPPAEIAVVGPSETRGWGKPPDAKSTVKMEAVHIPDEAYRDPPSKDSQLETVDAEVPTVRRAVPSSQPGEDPPTDEIDVDW